MSLVNIQKLSVDEIKMRGINNWPIWEKEVSRFDWTYASKEECLILEGDFNVETGDATFHIKAGDFVTFERGLKCVWDIKTAVKKHYNFE